MQQALRLWVNVHRCIQAVTCLAIFGHSWVENPTLVYRFFFVIVDDLDRFFRSVLKARTLFQAHTDL